MSKKFQQVTGKTPATTEKVWLSEIHTDTELFQHRAVGEVEDHVRDLIDAINRGDKLDKMTLWRSPDDGRLYVLDGHHRLKAYRATKRYRKASVWIFEGEQRDARKISINANRKVRLGLTQADRTNAAWALVKNWDPEKASEGHEYSVSEVHKTTGVSTGLVSKMRSVLKDAHDRDGTKPSSLPSQWWRALSDKNDANREQPSEDEMEEQTKARANAYDAQIGEAIAKMAREDPDALGRVLGRRAGSRAHTIFGFCETSLDEDELAELEDEDELAELSDEEMARRLF